MIIFSVLDENKSYEGGRGKNQTFLEKVNEVEKINEGDKIT